MLSIESILSTFFEKSQLYFGVIQYRPKGCVFWTFWSSIQFVSA